MDFKLKDMWKIGNALRQKSGNKSQKSWKHYEDVKVLIFDKFKEMLNIKNKTEYILLSNEVINATNSQDGQQMCLYTDGNKLYVREFGEFEIKFCEVK